MWELPRSEIQARVESPMWRCLSFGPLRGGLQAVAFKEGFIKLRHVEFHRSHAGLLRGVESSFYESSKVSLELER